MAPRLLLLLICAAYVCAFPELAPVEPWDDVNFPKAPKTADLHRSKRQVQFRYKYIGMGGTIHEDYAPDRIEVAATPLLSEEAHQVGAEIVALMLRNVPTLVFTNLVSNGGRVGLFTSLEGTTIYPEYAHLRDRPECEGTCAGACSNTCTSDGRKYDSLAGLGGIRATCLDDNFMCTPDDPYRRQSNILVHEFSHTLEQYSLPTNIQNQILSAYQAALVLGTWDRNSYAMSTRAEYFAEASSTFFNVNHHPSSSGGMNSCGRTSGFCQTEDEARTWLDLMDPDLYDAIDYAFTDRRDLPGNLSICMV